MKRQKRHITILLLLTFAFYSSGQALLLNHCECHDNTAQTEAWQCCCENENAAETMKANCHSIGFSLDEKLANPESNTCQNCSVRCVQPENFDADIPTVFYQISFELKKNIESKIVFNFDNNNDNQTISNLRPQDSDQDFIPTRFGKILLIKLNSLKIPAHIS